MRRRARRGGVLLETLLAAILLAVALTVVLRSLSASVSAQKRTKEWGALALAVDKKMFELRVKGFWEGPASSAGEGVLLREIPLETVGPLPGRIKEIAVGAPADEERPSRVYELSTYLLGSAAGAAP